MDHLRDLRKKVNARRALYDESVTRYRREKEEVQRLESELRVALEAQAIAQSVARQIQQEAHTQIAAVVSRCLEAVFDEPYTFKIDFEQKRGKTEAVLIFERDGLEVDPMTASGGGVVDVAALALRLAALVLSRPEQRRVLILDEPFKFVSETFRGRVRVLLEQLSTEMGVQFIMVTHIKELELGKVIRLDKDEVSPAVRGDRCRGLERRKRSTAVSSHSILAGKLRCP